MADLKVRPRPTGATAVLGRTGFPHVTSATRGELDIVTGAVAAGFQSAGPALFVAFGLPGAECAHRRKPDGRARQDHRN